MNFQIALKDADGTMSIQTNGTQLIQKVTAFYEEKIQVEADPLLKTEIDKASFAPKGFEPYWLPSYDAGGDGIGGHGIYDSSNRQNTATASQQVSADTESGFRSVEIDLDYDLKKGVGGTAKHILFQGLPNLVTGGQSNPYKVYEKLQKNPNIAIKPNYKITK
jgi:hypothetical protein